MFRPGQDLLVDGNGDTTAACFWDENPPCLVKLRLDIQRAVNLEHPQVEIQKVK